MTQRREIAETMADRSGDEAWLTLTDCRAFDQFDSVARAVEFIEANCMEPEHFAEVSALTEKQIQALVETVQSAAVDNCGSIDTEAYADSVRSAGENMAGRGWREYDAPRELTTEEIAMVVERAL